MVRQAAGSGRVGQVSATRTPGTPPSPRCWKFNALPRVGEKKPVPTASLSPAEYRCPATTGPPMETRPTMRTANVLEVAATGIETVNEVPGNQRQQARAQLYVVQRGRNLLLTHNYRWSQPLGYNGE